MGKIGRAEHVEVNRSIADVDRHRAGAQQAIDERLAPHHALPPRDRIDLLADRTKAHATYNDAIREEVDNKLAPRGPGVDGQSDQSDQAADEKGGEVARKTADYEQQAGQGRVRRDRHSASRCRRSVQITCRDEIVEEYIQTSLFI